MVKEYIVRRQRYLEHIDKEALCLGIFSTEKEALNKISANMREIGLMNKGYWRFLDQPNGYTIDVGSWSIFYSIEEVEK